MNDDRLKELIESLKPKDYDLNHPVEKFEKSIDDLRRGKIKMEEVHMTYGIKELTDVIVFLAKLSSTIKASLDDDGKITLGDAFKFTGLVFPLVDAITNIQDVPKEFLDMTPQEREAVLDAVRQHLDIASNDKEAVESALKVVFELFNFLRITGAIKPNN